MHDRHPLASKDDMSTLCGALKASSETDRSRTGRNLFSKVVLCPLNDFKERVPACPIADACEAVSAPGHRFYYFFDCPRLLPGVIFILEGPGSHCIARLLLAILRRSAKDLFALILQELPIVVRLPHPTSNKESSGHYGQQDGHFSAHPPRLQPPPDGSGMILRAWVIL